MKTCLAALWFISPLSTFQPPSSSFLKGFHVHRLSEKFHVNWSTHLSFSVSKIMTTQFVTGSIHREPKPFYQWWILWTRSLLIPSPHKSSDLQFVRCGRFLLRATKQRQVRCQITQQFNSHIFLSVTNLKKSSQILFQLFISLRSNSWNLLLNQTISKESHIQSLYALHHRR